MVEKPLKKALKKTLKQIQSFKLGEKLDLMRGNWECVSRKGRKYVCKTVEGEFKYAVPWSDYLQFQKVRGTIEQLVRENTTKYGTQVAIEMALSTVGLPSILTPFVADFLDV